jgi:hypothetical protein
MGSLPSGDLLTAFTDLAGVVITADALHTQGDTARTITGRHAGYVMTVKPGMPARYEQLKKLPWGPASPPLTASTPATRSGRSSCVKPHERLCRDPGR